MTAAFTVAIDGPVAAGKTTIGRMLAQATGALFFDTGIVYRAVAHRALARAVDPRDDAAVSGLAASIKIELRDEQGDTRLLADGADISDELRSPEIDRALPPISANPGVRRALLDCQRSAIAGRSAVVVGRDIGTVILPEADLKIYLDAAPQVRAQRRYDELRARGVEIDPGIVLRDLLARDERDSSRAHAPLQQAPDAVVINATDMTAEAVVAVILERVAARQRKCAGEAE